MNNIFIDGFLCADADLRRTQNGKKVTSARIIHHDIPGVNAPAENDPDYSFSENE